MFHPHSVTTDVFLMPSHYEGMSLCFWRLFTLTRNSLRGCPWRAAREPRNSAGTVQWLSTCVAMSTSLAGIVGLPPDRELLHPWPRLERTAT